MEPIYLITIILGISGQGIAKKAYSRKTAGGGVYTFSLLSVLSAMMFFILRSPNLQWQPALLPYAVFFALTYGAGVTFHTIAMSCGPLSLTSLVSSFSLMIPTFYGLIFLREPIRPGLIPGITLLAASLLLINRKGDRSPVTAKWFFCSLTAFLGNGLCSVAQKMQQSAFGGSYKSEFMILSLAMVCAIILAVTVKAERRNFRRFVCAGWYLAVGCGALNGLVNLFVMILTGLMSASLMYPLMSVGGIVVSFLVSKFFYRENLTRTQFIGFLAGIAAIVFLNL